MLSHPLLHLVALALCLAVSLPLPAKPPSQGSEVMWDRYGVPHVFAKTTEDLFYGYGWAQAHSHGNLGIFRVITFGPMKDRKRVPIHGETFVICVEFAKTPRAYALMSYGNASQPNTSHAEDQLEWMTRKALRPVLRSRPEVMKNLERHDRF